MSAWRQEWARTVRSAGALSMTARLLGQVIALDHADDGIGCGDPGRKALARHLGKSEATIRRALTELIAGGWLRRNEVGTGRNRRAAFKLLRPGGDVVPFPDAQVQRSREVLP